MLELEHEAKNNRARTSEHETMIGSICLMNNFFGFHILNLIGLQNMSNNEKKMASALTSLEIFI